jgi:hypothetical protein
MGRERRGQRLRGSGEASLHAAQDVLPAARQSAAASAAGKRARALRACGRMYILKGKCNPILSYPILSYPFLCAGAAAAPRPPLRPGPTCRTRRRRRPPAWRRRPHHAAPASSEPLRSRRCGLACGAPAAARARPARFGRPRAVGCCGGGLRARQAPSRAHGGPTRCNPGRDEAAGGVGRACVDEKPLLKEAAPIGECLILMLKVCPCDQRSDAHFCTG